MVAPSAGVRTTLLAARLGSPSWHGRGFRRYVLALFRERGATLMRYPGGNFLSGYNWGDGVGPRHQRPARLDLAWGSTETNQSGTNEFGDWCREADAEPMLGVNLGTTGSPRGSSPAPGTFW